MTPTIRLGLIGRSGTDNDHLHFAAYNNAAGTTSYNPGIIRNTATISFTGPTSIGSVMSP